MAKSFEELAIFQDARELTKKIYALTEAEPWRSDFRFVAQIHAAAGSIADNIAEGFEREGNKEFINFLYYAKGSCGETRSQVIRAYDVKFIDKETYESLYGDCLALSRKISKFITSLKDSGLGGSKFKGQGSK